MFEILFGADMPLAARLVIALVIIVGLIGATAWVVRRSAPTASARRPHADASRALP